MKTKKPKSDIRKAIKRYSRYFGFIAFFSIGCQIFADQVLSKYAFFEAGNFDDILINLFVVQITIIILPLSLFGVFTEVTNELYLGQNVAKYMYDLKYRERNRLFEFSYKEVIIISLALSLVSYFLMAKKLLSAELMIVVLSTVITIRSLFSWINIRIHIENLHELIMERLKDDIVASMIKEFSKVEIFNHTISDVLPRVKNWVVNGDDYELNEVKRFHEHLYINIESINTLFNRHLDENETEEGYISLYYREIDEYFDELVAELLRKEDWYRALKLSSYILDVNAQFRRYNHYHLEHYHYSVFCKIFEVINEMQIELMGDDWLVHYLIEVLGNGNIARGQHNYIKAQKVYTEKETHEFNAVVKEGYEFVYNSLMAMWENDSLRDEYKRRFVEKFLSYGSLHKNTSHSQLHVILKLLQTKNAVIVDAIIDKCIDLSWFDYNKDQFGHLVKMQHVVLSYIYYLYSCEEMTGITIPHMKTYEFITREHLLSFLSDRIWDHYEAISELLFEYRQPSLETFSSISYNNCRTARDEFVMYSAIINGIFDFQSMTETKLLRDIILHFSSILHDGERLESEKNKFKSFAELFGYSHMIEDEALSSKFYNLMKAILQYCTAKSQAHAKEFNYTEYAQRQNELVFEYLLEDELTLKFCNYEQADGKAATDLVTFNHVFQIVPHSSDFYAKWIMRGLQYEVAKKWHQGNLNELKEFSEDRKGFMEDLKKYLDKPDRQSQLKMCEILSLSTTLAQLNDDEINELIETTESGFMVSFYLHGDDFWMKSMGFRTKNEAIDYVKSNFSKMVYCISLYFDET